MLGNQVELWESMLAVIKLGAVVMPTTTAVGPGDLVDRMERGAARAVITNASEVHKFDDVPGDYVRVAVGGADPAGTATDGWERHEAAYDLDVPPTEHPGTGARRPDAALLHVRHDEPAQARRAHPALLPRRAPVDDVLDRPAARRRAPQHQQPRLGQARVVVVLRAVGRRGDGLRLQLQPVRPGRPAAGPAHARGHLDLRAADRVADAHQERPVRRARARCARSSAPASRSTPRSSPRSRRRGA